MHIEHRTEKEHWISETQAFQRTVGTPESSYEKLAAEWDGMSARARRQAVISIDSHRAIQNVTRRG